MWCLVISACLFNVERRCKCAEGAAIVFDGALPNNRIAEDAVDEGGAERATEDTATSDLTTPPLPIPCLWPRPPARDEEVVVVKGGSVDGDSDWDKR